MNDILYLILSECKLNSTDTITLRLKCCLLSKEWASICQYFLCRDIIVHSDNHMKKIFSYFRRNPQHLIHIKNLSIICQAYNCIDNFIYLSFINFCSNLNCLTIYTKRSFSKHLHIFQRKKHFSLIIIGDISYLHDLFLINIVNIMEPVIDSIVLILHEEYFNGYGFVLGIPFYKRLENATHLYIELNVSHNCSEHNVQIPNSIYFYGLEKAHFQTSYEFDGNIQHNYYSNESFKRKYKYVTF